MEQDNPAGNVAVTCMVSLLQIGHIGVSSNV